MEIRAAIYLDADDGSLVIRRSITELCQADHEGDAGTIAAWNANKTPDMWRVWLNQESSSLYVAVEAGFIVGVGMMDSSGEILLNYVSPDARFLGISKALLAHMEVEARRRGLQQCRLTSTKTALAFYEAAGYRAESDTIETEPRMIKRLDRSS